MWFLNKTTNCKFDIYDKYHQERLIQDDNYELIEEEKHETLEVKVDNVEIIEVENKIDLDKLSYTELQDLAKSKGLKSVGIKKEDLIKSLQ